jgi:GT2 family glycosyltransferase
VVHFLEQALYAVRKALRNTTGEVWVVDNNSVDDSVRMMQEKFPEVKIIANKHNPGFAVANNQAIKQCNGEYVLLLNPDTLVEEDTFEKCVQFMDKHPEAGALGVKLIDGSGKFLPESKRGFPTPWVAFCKTFGLSSLFPKSKTFNQYYLGFLPEDETHEIDVLVGCFMFMRQTALDKAGLLDEAFFMYGEDIDLSYRITQAGYKNIYFPETKTIHYKGESTKKGSLNYVKVFYQAMIIFTQKHFKGRSAGLFILMLQAAIWFRAGITLARGFFQQIWLVVLDVLLILVGLFLLKDFWAVYQYNDPNYYKRATLWINFPLYVLIWLVSVWISGGYDARYNFRKLIRGLAIGTLFLAAVYGFLNLDYRPSRALILLGAVWATFITISVRLGLHYLQFGHLNIGRSNVKNLVIIGEKQESERVSALLNQANVVKNKIGTVAPDSTFLNTPVLNDRFYLSDLSQLEEVVNIYKVNELIFCSKNVSAQTIMHWMTRLGPNVAYKIVPEESLSIIGSSSKDEPGELYTIAIKYNLADFGQKRNKRVLDVAFCGLMPIFLLISKHRKHLLKGFFPVLLGKKTWIAYASSLENRDLPKIKPGVFTVLEGIKPANFNDATVTRLNFIWAKDWSIWKDMEVLWRVAK